MIKIKYYASAQNFLNDCESFMLKQESINNLIIGLTDSIIRSVRKYPNAHFFGVFLDNQVIGAALNTDEDHPLSITEISQEGIKKLVDFINTKKIKLSGIVGEEKSAKEFAQIYSESNQNQFKLLMHLGIYETNQITIPQIENLKIIVAAEIHRSIAKDYILGFMNDCFPKSSLNEQRSTEMLERHLKNKTLFLLTNENDEIVSMAANSRETKNTACISLVYTPEKFRKKGYGSIITALVSQRMLDAGKAYCNLFTDLLNPTSNSIYQKIGYKVIGRSKHFEFRY